jgi:DNA-binding ferritin-like protein
LSILSKVEDENAVPSAQEMANILLQDSEKMSKIYQIVFQESEAMREHGLSDFIAGRLDAHRKHAWMLRSTLK